MTARLGRLAFARRAQPREFIAAEKQIDDQVDRLFPGTEVAEERSRRLAGPRQASSGPRSLVAAQANSQRLGLPRFRFGS